MAAEGVACILVHHNSYSTVGRTVEMLASDGLDRAAILVVDNSEDPARRDELERSVAGVEVLYLANRGYGAAVNAGVAHLASAGRLPECLLVATHEAVPRKGALRALLDELTRDDSVAAVGPTLLVGPEGDYKIWSCGGGRTERLHAHRHEVPPLSLEEMVHLPSRERLWLDGAFVLYRARILAENRFDERYFMYMEEADLHYRLRAAGYSCIWTPRAIVWQSTGLTPPFYFARNIKLFYRKNEDPLRAIVAPPLLVGRDILRRVRRRDVRGAIEGFKGFLAQI